MRLLLASLFLLSLLTITLLQNQQAFSHRDFPSDGKSYRTIVTLKQISFYAGAPAYDITSNDDYVFGWRVELDDHPMATSTGTFVDENSVGAILKPNTVVLDHIECGPKSNLRFHGWGVESDQPNILGTDKVMRDIIKNSVSSDSQVTARHVFESIGDNFIGFRSDLATSDDAAASELYEKRLYLNGEKTIALQFLVDRQTIWDDTKCKTNTISENPEKTMVKQGNDGSIMTKSQTTDKKPIEKKSEGVIDSKQMIKKPDTGQIKISNDDLRSLYLISKWQESTVVSLSNVNDQEKVMLEKLTTSSGKTGLSKDQKTAMKSLLKKQDTDKKNINLVRDMTKKVSAEIKKIAQKQGVSSSELDKISKTAQKTGKPTKTTPINQLKQGADDAKTNLEQARKEQEKHDAELNRAASQLGAILTDDNSQGPFLPKSGNTDSQAFTPDKTNFENMRVITDKDGTVFIIFDPEYAKQQEQDAAEKSKQNVISLLQQALDLLLKEEQSQVSTILNDIPEPTLKDLFTSTGNPTQNQPRVATPNTLQPVTEKPKTEPTGTKIQLQSKHGSYTPPDNACRDNRSTVLATWVLARSSNIDSGIATVFLSDLEDESAISSLFPATVRDGIVQSTFRGIAPGHYQIALFNVDNRIVTDGVINITIPDLCTAVPPTPSTVMVKPSPDTTKLPPAPSNTGPRLTIPKQVTQEATSISGATVNYNVSAQDNEDGTITPSCDHPSGSQFPIGSTTVMCTVKDSNNNSVQGSFTIVVRDTTPPVIDPIRPTEGTRDDSGVVVFFDVTAHDAVDGTVTPNCNYQSGTKFPIGVTILTCTADDSKGNHSSRSLQITVTKTVSGQ